MKQNRLRTIFAVALACLCMGAWADSRIFISEMLNGTITASNVTETGEQTVTLTITPADNYFIETSDIIVSKTSGTAQTRGVTPDFANKLTVTAVTVDSRGKGTYQFTVPDGYGAYVEASFTPCIAITPTVTIAGWTYGTTISKPQLTGNTGNGEVTFTYAKKGSEVFNSSVPENAGDYIIKASISAIGHYLAGEATADFTISKAAGSISYKTASINKTYGEADFTNDLTVVGDGTVSFVSDKPSVATVDEMSGKVTIIGSGNAKITATVTDGTNYAYSVKTTSYTINVSTAKMEVTASGYEGIYDGKPHGISVTAPKDATIMYGESEGNCTLEVCPTYTSSGTYTVYYEVTMANYTPVIGYETVIIILLGDANNDGIINAADIVEMINAYKGQQSDCFNLKNADIDGNGQITDKDINEVVKIIMSNSSE